MYHLRLNEVKSPLAVSIEGDVTTDFPLWRSRLSEAALDKKAVEMRSKKIHYIFIHCHMTEKLCDVKPQTYIHKL